MDNYCHADTQLSIPNSQFSIVNCPLFIVNEMTIFVEE